MILVKDITMALFTFQGFKFVCCELQFLAAWWRSMSLTCAIPLARVINAFIKIECQHRSLCCCLGVMYYRWTQQHRLNIHTHISRLPNGAVLHRSASLSTQNPYFPAIQHWHEKLCSNRLLQSISSVPISCTQRT